ncbi:MAG TPA: LOG family protein [Pirellulaceae bacterium]
MNLPEENDAKPRPGQRRTQDLIDRIRVIADKLDRDNSSRGDLKLLSRTLQELRYAFKVFSPFRARRKVTVFGSARTPPGSPAYQQAVAFGQRIVEQNWMVITGAASGIMEAGHVGAGRENSLGLNILLPFEQEANAVIEGDEKLVHMKYFFTRKLMFVKECHAVVCLPGGFGTLDETFEVLTLLQTGKCDLMPLVLLDEPGGTYWESCQRFVREHLLTSRMISSADLSLYRVTDRVETAVDELVRFYASFHSLRYVKDRLALRLVTAPTPEILDHLNREFRDICVEGGFTSQGPMSAELNEPELANLPRIVFRFNRRDHGRLRQLIDYVNSKLAA